MAAVANSLTIVPAPSTNRSEKRWSHLYDLYLPTQKRKVRPKRETRTAPSGRTALHAVGGNCQDAEHMLARLVGIMREACGVMLGLCIAISLSWGKRSEIIGHA